MCWHIPCPFLPLLSLFSCPPPALHNLCFGVGGLDVPPYCLFRRGWNALDCTNTGMGCLAVRTPKDSFQAGLREILLFVGARCGEGGGGEIEKEVPLFSAPFPLLAALATLHREMFSCLVCPVFAVWALHTCRTARQLCSPVLPRVLRCSPRPYLFCDRFHLFHPMLPSAVFLVFPPRGQ